MSITINITKRFDWKEGRKELIKVQMKEGRKKEREEER